MTLYIIASVDGLVPNSTPSHYLNQMMTLSLGPQEESSVKFYSKFRLRHGRKCIWKCRLQKGAHLVQAPMCEVRDPALLISLHAKISVSKLISPGQHGRHFADDIFKCIFLNENAWISIKISLKFVLNGLINNISALIQIMAWRRQGDKPLSEHMVVRLPTHICVTRPQWFKNDFQKWHLIGWQHIRQPEATVYHVRIFL